MLKRLLPTLAVTIAAFALTSVAASADEDAGSTGADGPPVPGNEDDQRLLEARQIADLRRRLGLD
jgi:hypothetical protein